MIITEIPPWLYTLSGALLILFLPRIIRPFFFLLTTAVALTAVLYFEPGTRLSLIVSELELVYLNVDELSRVFAVIFAATALIGGIYAFHDNRKAHQSNILFYAGSTLGVVYAGDYYTMLFFWEIMAFASTWLIWARRTEESDRAGFRYLMVHVAGGGILFTGILMQMSQTGSHMIVAHDMAHATTASWLILTGIAINAAIPPLHAWLPDAYPRATVTGAVFMSAFTTKSALYALARQFAGAEILIYAGTIMALYGVYYAMLASTLRQLLSYHIVSQVGYMVAAVGIGTQLAINGAAAHAFSHILYKAQLFMGAGAVLQATGTQKMSELGGLLKKQKLIFFFYMIGALSIGGFPLFNGFISKSIIVSAAGKAHLEPVMMLLLLAAVGTFLSTGLKLPYITWFKIPGLENREPVKSEPIPVNMYIAMGITGSLCFIYGIYPDLLYNMLPYAEVRYNPFTLHHFIETIEILTFTFAAFYIFRKKMVPHDAQVLDFDWFYRRPKELSIQLLVAPVEKFYAASERIVHKIVNSAAAFGRDPVSYFKPEPLRKASRPYSPDNNRASIEMLITAALGVFIVTILLVVFR